MITGFQATMEVDDGGTGSASAGTSTAFTGLVTLGFPSLEAPQFDATELNQDDGGGTPAPDEYEREEPTGTIKVGRTKAEIKYTKANYQRLQGLVGKRGKTFKVITPDDKSAGTATKLTATFVGNISKVDELKFEKGAPVLIPFEITCSRKPAYS